MPDNQLILTTTNKAQLTEMINEAVSESFKKLIIPTPEKREFEKIPITQIFKLKLISKPTFYEHVRSGTISLYKLGGRSYVDAKEFNEAFTKVKIAK